MKLLGILLTVLWFSSLNAQIHEHAIGLRGGNGGYYGYGMELSYQLGLGENNRLELDAGAYRRRNWDHPVWGNGGGHRIMSFTGVYHWHWNISNGLNWFLGPGAQLVFYNEYNNNQNDGVFFNLGGQIGLEYDFTEHGAPLHIGLDYRPMFFFGWYDGVGQDVSLSLRYLIN
jgi:hypothetical protein